jgi:alpha-mannosidase
MPYSELAILLPCHSLEDFPVYQEGPEAEGLLAAWSALWHPALLASARRLPSWYRADSPPDEVADRLFVIPAPSEPLLVAGWVSRAQDERACVVRKTRSRDEIVAAALAKLPDAPPVDSDLAGDFLALGLCYLLVELLTRQMRYMSNIDEIHLRNQAVAAATAACEGRDDEAREKLRTCFEVLTEARERFYPVEAYLIDLVLVAPSTLGSALRAELADPVPKSLLISGELVERLASEQPETLRALVEPLREKRVALVGGEYVEDQTPLLPAESTRRELERGLAAYERVLNTRPTVYGRRRFGLTPLLPALLSSAGFSGALHFTLDEGHFPHGGQSKTRWEGLDSTAIDALGRLPLDASKPESVLSYSRKMGETMDMDHVATLIFAHWPGQTSPFFADLRRMAAYAPALGKFVTLDDFFQKTDRPGELTKFRADQYRAPYLRQAIIREEENPLSQIVDRHINRLRAETVHAMTTLASLLCGTRVGPAIDLSATDAAPSDKVVLDAAAALADKLGCGRTFGGRPEQDAVGYLVLNPHSFSTRESLEIRDEVLPSAGGAVVAAQHESGVARVVVETPPMGFVWLGPAAPPSPPPASKRKSKAAEKEIAINNELVQVVVSRETGGVRSLYDIGQRGNLLSQQLAFRLPPPKPKPGDVWRDPDADAGYSTMTADQVEITAAGAAYMEITSVGRLVDPEGKRIAGFTQRVGLARGSRVAVIDVDLDTGLLPRADPWNSYYACRFAWGDETAELRRSVGLTSQFTDARNLEAPYFVEIRAAKTRATLLTGGWPYHRRVGERMLDTLLVVRGETRRRFRLGIGAGITHPAMNALSLMLRPIIVGCSTAPKAASGWLFHIDAKNVVATHWDVIDESDRIVGFRVRLWETEGRAGRVHLRCFRPPTSARQVGFAGQTLATLTVAGDTIEIEFSRYEWIDVEGRWA